MAMSVGSSNDGAMCDINTTPLIDVMLVLLIMFIITIPVMVAAFYWPHPQGHIITTAVFVLGALTDWLDGWIARRFNMGSAFGAFLDPVADKLAVVITLFIIVQRHHTVYMALLAAVIVGREITISALREWMAQIGASRSVAVHMIGKVKTSCLLNCRRERRYCF